MPNPIPAGAGGGGGGGNVSGAGTPGTLAIWTGPHALGDSDETQPGTELVITGRDLVIAGTAPPGPVFQKLTFRVNGGAGDIVWGQGGSDGSVAVFQPGIGPATFQLSASGDATFTQALEADKGINSPQQGITTPAAVFGNSEAFVYPPWDFATDALPHQWFITPAFPPGFTLCESVQMAITMRRASDGFGMVIRILAMFELTVAGVLTVTEASRQVIDPHGLGYAFAWNILGGTQIQAVVMTDNGVKTTGTLHVGLNIP